MFIVADLGNTNIAFGLAHGKKIIKAWNVPTKSTQNYSFFEKEMKKKTKGCKAKFIEIEEIIICSVVPEAEKFLTKFLRRFFGEVRILRIGKEVSIPIVNKYRHPKQVGNDRLVNAFAAICFYKCPAIIIDFGTAITLDVVSEKKEYLGGIIAPGIRMALSALYEKTALLPLLVPGRPKEIVGRDTKNSILSGVIFGFSALVDGLISVLENKFRRKIIIIGTGGDCSLMRAYSKKIEFFDPLLTLKGIVIIYNLMKNNEISHKNLNFLNF